MMQLYKGGAAPAADMRLPRDILGQMKSRSCLDAKQVCAERGNR